jgi:hypothetical protein
MIERASSAECCGSRGWLETGTTLPSILIAGGKFAVMKRSEPFFCVISRSSSCMNFNAWSVSTHYLLLARLA